MDNFNAHERNIWLQAISKNAYYERESAKQEKAENALYRQSLIDDLVSIHGYKRDEINSYSTRRLETMWDNA